MTIKRRKGRKKRTTTKTTTRITSRASFNDFDRDMKVNSFLLEEEWERQTQLVYDYVKLEAQAEEDRNRAKLNIDVVKARVEDAIRRKPDKYELEKTTDKAILAVVNKHEDVMDAYDRFFKAQRTYKAVAGALNAVSSQKKKALEKLYDGRANGIFAEPKATKGVKQELEHLEQKTREEIIRKLNK